MQLDKVSCIWVDMYYCFFFFVTNFCVNDKDRQINYKHSLNFFRTPWAYDFYQIKVDNSYEYIDSVGIKYGSPVSFHLFTYYTNEDSLSVYLKINDRDKSFIYPIIGIDSILLGMNHERQFVIFNEKEYVWKED